ncbi:MAG: T9SS type A sorting domain-containing protein [candidate division Zixibacteria bacterium]|nr:T9SS type A sorting domain-containing protein [candidate division Zixibacteria bacterium]
MNTLYRLLAAFLFVVILPPMVIAQEEWGPTQYVQIVGACSYNTSNPCFRDSLFCYHENIPFGEEHYRIMISSLDGYGESELLEGEYFDIEGVNYLSPFVAYAGNKLYFSSDMSGGYGGFDIYVSVWDGQQWGIPSNLGQPVNTESNEFGASLPLNESELYFFRNNDNWAPFSESFVLGIVYKSDYIDGNWGNVVELPSQVNSEFGSGEPSISPSGDKLYFCSYRPEIAEHIFAYVSYFEENNWAEPELLNHNINFLIDWPPWSYDDGDVLSISIDLDCSSLIITHYAVYEGFLEGHIRISHLTVDIDDPSPMPKAIELSAYPNPFNARTTINFSLAKQSPMELSIYDIAGRLVETLHRGELRAGPHCLTWNAANLPSGVYFARLSAEDNSSIKKLALIK